ncbi:MAG: HPr kinase/phosphatase C-terminal domain-containing protein [Alphaproteobacteria bacterium]|nr:HPr kinase/phosphatase C-terminal domain-containing protein [Alphaproteobacteria bacterium]MBV9694233.1 HPr kinase/phosphatase C-terminal domain-containing protein [Alphaproteobacteria bacterium]
MRTAKVANIHASSVLVGRAAASFGSRNDAGVLVMGRSGAGKSDLALRLIERGAILVSDDRTELLLHRGTMIARPPAAIRGLLEVRSVGILAVPFAPKARVALVVALDGSRARLPEREFWRAPWDLPVPVPLLRLAAFDPSAPAKVLLAVAAFERNLFRDDAGART